MTRGSSALEAPKTKAIGQCAAPLMVYGEDTLGGWLQGAMGNFIS